MVRLIGKLLVLVAVLIMPLGMSGAAASPHHVPMAGMAMDHCPDPGSKHQANGSFAECTMACSAALPAVDLSSGARLPIACGTIVPAAQKALRAFHPKIATPPPRRS